MTIFHQPERKLFVWQAFLQERKKTLATWASIYLFFLHKKSCLPRSFRLRRWKNCQHQHKGKHTPGKNLRMLQFLWKMQLHIHCTSVQLRPHVYVPEEPGWFHIQEAAAYHQEGVEPHQVLAKEDVHTMSPFHGQNHRNKELVNLDIHAVSFYVACTVLHL